MAGLTAPQTDTNLNQSSFTSWSKPNLQGWMPSDWQTASSSLKQTSDQEAEQALKKIKEQLNTTRVIGANLTLARAIVGLERKVMDVDAEFVKNRLHFAKTQMGLQFEAEKIKIDHNTLVAKLSAHDEKSQSTIQTEQTLVGIFQQKNQLKVQAAQNSLAEAQAKLGAGGNAPGLPGGNGVLGPRDNTPDRARQKARDLRDLVRNVN